MPVHLKLIGTTARGILQYAARILESVHCDRQDLCPI